MTTINDPSRIPVRWLKLVRYAWILLTLSVLGAHLAGLALRAGPAPQAGTGGGWQNWSETETRAAYAELGLTPEDFLRFIRTVNLLLPYAYFALAVFIFWRRPDDWVAVLASLLFLTFLATGPLDDQLAALNPVWGTVNEIIAAFSTVLFFMLFCVFPDGRFVPRWTLFFVFAQAGIAMWRVLYPSLYQQYAFVLTGPMFLVLPFAQVYRYFRVSHPAQRRAIKWIVFWLAAGMAPLGIYLVCVFLLLPGDLQRPNALGVITFMIGSGLWALLILIMPLAFTVAIVRSRLWDIDILIRRTLIYGVLTGLLALFYFGAVVVLQQLFRGLTGQGGDLAIILSTLAIAAVSVPLKNRVQQAIDRRFYRRKYNAAHVLESFAATVRDEVDWSKLTDNLMTVVEETMQPESVSLWVRGTTKERMKVKDPGGDER